MSYQLYRNTTPGTTLQECLDEMIQNNQISPYSALQIMVHFDQVINNCLGNQLNYTINFKGNLSSYRYFDNVWTFVIDRLSIKDGINMVYSNKVKIVACEGKSGSRNYNRKRKNIGNNITNNAIEMKDETESFDI